MRCERPVEAIEFTLSCVVLPFEARPCRLFRYIGNVEDLDGVNEQLVKATIRLADLLNAIVWP